MNEWNNAEYQTPTAQESRDLLEIAQREGVEIKEGDTVLDWGKGFDFDGFQVVRREFFAHLNEPAVTFNDCKFYVNMACLSKFPNTEYVQVLVNKKRKIMALRPCGEMDRDSFPWCSTSKPSGKRKPKQTTCRLFYAKIVSLMGWDPNHRYKIIGKLVRANDKYLLAFDLNAKETYQRTFVEGKKPKTARTPVFPAEWQDQFGMPYREHEQSLQINIFDGYAIYSIKDATDSKLEEPMSDDAPKMERRLQPSANREVTQVFA